MIEKDYTLPFIGGRKNDSDYSNIENGSYSPNRVLHLGNKYDNLDNAYIVFKVPDRYLNYFFYIYAVNGKHKYTFPLTE